MVEEVTLNKYLKSCVSFDSSLMLYKNKDYDKTYHSPYEGFLLGHLGHFSLRHNEIIINAVLFDQLVVRTDFSNSSFV